ncbi:MAG TPA: sugar ABC transporter ATP-binding protein [Candidatus Faecousia intestinigallinarum]|nr:sugar ABC transporter ATP-binding protein [Candidatus Faecousia intestinigallinarum]
MENTILSFRGLSKSFPGVQALDDVSFSLQEGEVLALLGENGAGKSTLVKCLTGANIPTSGTITLFGKDYTAITPGAARKLGISAVYQEFNLVQDLPIVENVFMGNNPGNGFLVDYKQMLKKCREIFDSFGIPIDPTENVSTLSPALMQIVEIAKAIALDLRILILDEPTAPLTTNETEILFNIIRSLKAKGVSVIYISHRLEEIFDICDRAVVLRDGKYIGETPIASTSRKELIKMMIGRELTSYYPDHASQATQEVAMKVSHVSGNGAKDISFTLHKGEILGVAGLVGAGRTELMTLLFCDAKRESGTVEINGKPFQGKRPWHAIAAGMAYLPEDRKRTGLLLDKSVALNTTLASIKKYCRFGIINSKKEKACIETYCKKLQVKTPSYEQEVQYLSGGNQQKVIVGKWLATDSEIIIFDEPTRGIDVGTKHEIYEIIHSLADEGRAIIMVSSEFEELMGVADRILVMAEGELMGSLEKDSFDKEVLLDMASGRR